MIDLVVDGRRRERAAPIRVWGRMVRDPQGRYLVLGRTPTPSLGQPVVARFTSTGDIDPSYGFNGYVFDNSGLDLQAWNDLVVDGDRAYVLGSRLLSPFDEAVAEVSPEGELTVLSLRPQRRACCVARDSCGRTIVGGSLEAARFFEGPSREGFPERVWFDENRVPGVGTMLVLPDDSVVLAAPLADRRHVVLGQLGAAGPLLFEESERPWLRRFETVDRIARLSNGDLALAGRQGPYEGLIARVLMTAR